MSLAPRSPGSRRHQFELAPRSKEEHFDVDCSGPNTRPISSELKARPRIEQYPNQKPLMVPNSLQFRAAFPT